MKQILLTGLFAASILAAQASSTPPATTQKTAAAPAAPGQPPASSASAEIWAAYWQNEALYFQAEYEDEHSRYMALKFPQQSRAKQNADAFYVQQQQKAQQDKQAAAKTQDPAKK